MRRAIVLDGAWERRDFLDEAWRWSDALRVPDAASAADGPPAQAGISSGWRPASVPGSAIDDAWRAGEAPNPYLDRDSLAAEWVPERTWLYRRRFRVPAEAVPHTVLRFEGIDPGGIVLLDGDEIGRHRGMFVPYEVDVSDRVAPDTEHDLVVVVDAPPPMPSQVGRTDRVSEHRSRMTYGWDFCPRMVHSGIWRTVTLETFAARIGHPRIETSLAADGARAELAITASVDGAAVGSRLTARLLDGSDVRAEATSVVRDGAARVELAVDSPRLWWPNGLGEPVLHRLELDLAADGVDLDRLALSIGIRNVLAVRTEGAAPDARPYTLEVNGRRTWIRGWNWVPLDATFGVPRPDRLRHLIELARRANVNLLRVWGGGLIESDSFYDACDAAGIMVWQEFAQSSSGVANAPAEDPNFVALMRRETEMIVPLRAHHPSLVIWCGGNELTDPDGRPLDDTHPVLGALAEVVARVDPARTWLPTSPSGPRFENSPAAAAAEPASLHDVHGPWEHAGLVEQRALATGTTSLLHSEFGAEGMTNLVTLEATVSEALRVPHDRTNPTLAHRGAWWNNAPLVARLFGGSLPPDSLAHASQHLQADGLRTLVEGDRRRWPRNAGAIPWQMNESFPNAWCTSAVDWFGMPKAAYRAVADAFGVVAIGLGEASPALAGDPELRLRPWVVNDTDAALTGPLRIRLRDATGRRLGGTDLDVDAPANAVTEVGTVALAVAPDAADVLVLDAAFDAARVRRLFSRTADLAPLGSLPPAELDATLDADGACVRLGCRGGVGAVDVRLLDADRVGWPGRDGAAYPAADVLTLLPGESRAVDVDWVDVPPGSRRLLVAGPNVTTRWIGGA